MKLLNYTTFYFALILLVILSVWAGLFYYAMLDEIYDSMDDGLENQKMLVMQKASKDSTVLDQPEFEDGYYTIKRTSAAKHLAYKDLYKDTLMFMQNEQDFEPVRMLVTVFRQNGQLYEMRVITSMVEEDDLIEGLIISLLWLYLGLLLSILVLNNLLLKKIWKPFYTLLSKMRQFRLEKPSQIQAGYSNIEEFKLLNTAVREVLQSNINTYLAQKQFIENASHELQTPLGIIRNKLELLVEKNTLTEAQARDLAVIMDSVNRMSRLNKSLMLLSKIENRQFPDTEEISLSEIVHHLVAAFDDLIEYRNLNVTIEDDGSGVVSANRELSHILLTNLIKNAITHSPPGSKIHIRVKNHRLTITNAGERALDEKHIFDRFYKGSQSVESTGLGLSIAKAIADQHQFTLGYYHDGNHNFTLEFQKNIPH